MTFAKDSRLEVIGTSCFSASKISEFVLPKTLQQISEDAFSDCNCLGKIYVEEGCEAGLS